MIGVENNDPITNVGDNDLHFLPKTFFWMFLGLLSTAIVAIYTYYSGLFTKIIFGGEFQALLLAELIVVVVFSLMFRKLSPAVVGILYFLYAAINGVSMACIFYLFELNSVILLFVASALFFGAFALIGYYTNSDLSNWRTLLYGILIIGIIVSIINLFAGNPMIDVIVDWVILFTFFGITIYDMNKIKQLSLIPEIDQSKMHIYGAMQLYLDFINIFLRLLSIFGKRRR